MAIAHKEFDVKPATDELIDIAVIEVGHAEGTWVQGAGYGQRLVYTVGAVDTIWHGGVGGGLRRFKLKRFFGGVSG